MYKCIYCNSDDLSVSDIIPYALTGAKLTRRFVCHEHNSFTNDSFEKAAIAHWDFFRSSLGIRERSGAEIKFNAEFRADGVTVPNMTVSGRSSIYEDKKRLFPGEQDGHKVLIGNIDKLLQKKGVNADDVKPLNMQDAVISVKMDLVELFASEEMLRTMAKIAYEWHCYIHDIDGFESDKYQNIVDCIMMKRSVEDYVEIAVDGIADQSLAMLCYLGNHGVYEYDDVDGFRYVVFFFWGIMLYKIRICSTDGVKNYNNTNTYDLFIYGIDGEKDHSVFGVLGKPHLISMPATDAVRTYHELYVSKLDRLVKTTVLSLAKVKEMIAEVKAALSVYKREPHDFARFVDYESENRFQALRVLFFFNEYQGEYDFEKSFNENMKLLINSQEQLVVSEEEKKAFLLRLQTMHQERQLANSVESGIAFFDKISEQIN